LWILTTIKQAYFNSDTNVTTIEGHSSRKFGPPKQNVILPENLDPSKENVILPERWVPQRRMSFFQKVGTLKGESWGPQRRIYGEIPPPPWSRG
jgi:hypothetical protein